MNRSELIDAMAERSGLTKSDADKALRALIDTITDATRSRAKVSIPGFLTFDVSHRGPRVARNPRTGEEIKVDATWAPKVSAGSGLKAAAAESE